MNFLRFVSCLAMQCEVLGNSVFQCRVAEKIDFLGSVIPTGRGTSSSYFVEQIPCLGAGGFCSSWQ